MKKMLNKITAVMMMGLVFLTPLTNSAFAASKGGAHKPARQERQVQRHEFKTVARHVKNVPRHGTSHVPAHRNNDHDDSGALVGGLILGVILGAAIADANANGN